MSLEDAGCAAPDSAWSALPLQPMRAKPPLLLPSIPAPPALLPGWLLQPRRRAQSSREPRPPLSPLAWAQTKSCLLPVRQSRPVLRTRSRSPKTWKGTANRNPRRRPRLEQLMQTTRRQGLRLPQN